MDVTAPQPERREQPANPVRLYREALAAINQAIQESPLYSVLRDHETDYDQAKDLLDDEIAGYMEMVGPDNPDLFDAYASLPMFREWLVEDVLESNYQDVVMDQRLAPERYADSPDAPGWVRESPAVDSMEPDQGKDDTETPPAPEAVPDAAGAGMSDMSKQPEDVDTAPAEPDLTPNVEEYLNLKAQYPDKLIGVRVGDYMLFYGKDAEEAAPVLGTNVVTREIDGLGETTVTGKAVAWQAVLRPLREHGKSVVLAGPDEERGPDAPYEIIQNVDSAEYIPLGMELTVDGRRMQIDSVDYNAGTVSLRDLDLNGWFPVFRSEPVSIIRELVEEVQSTEEYIAADIEAQRRKDQAAEAQAADVAKEPETASTPLPEPEQVEFDGGQITALSAKPGTVGPGCTGAGRRDSREYPR